MALYFFHIQDDDALIEDLEGSELSHERAAHDEAVCAARTILADALRTGREPTGHAVIIADEQGRRIGVVRFVDLLPQKIKADLVRA